MSIENYTIIGFWVTLVSLCISFGFFWTSQIIQHNAFFKLTEYIKKSSNKIIRCIKRESRTLKEEINTLKEYQNKKYINN